ncbi:MAG: hypothetical protein RSE00_04210 [Clostridia bacterium]
MDNKTKRTGTSTGKSAKNKVTKENKSKSAPKKASKNTSSAKPKKITKTTNLNTKNIRLKPLVKEEPKRGKEKILVTKREKKAHKKAIKLVISFFILGFVMCRSIFNVYIANF